VYSISLYRRRLLIEFRLNNPVHVFCRYKTVELDNGYLSRRLSDEQFVCIKLLKLSSPPEGQCVIANSNNAPQFIFDHLILDDPINKFADDSLVWAMVSNEEFEYNMKLKIINSLNKMEINKRLIKYAYYFKDIRREFRDLFVMYEKIKSKSLLIKKKVANE
jgi:hypothetical protein